MLEITDNPAVLPVTGPTPLDLNGMLSPAQNLANGYNIAEQTCFHKTTVGHLIPSLRAISGFLKGLTSTLQLANQLVTDTLQLIKDCTSLVGSTVTLLGAVRTLVATILTVVATVIGLITAIIGTLGAINTALLVAAGASIAAGVLIFLPGPFHVVGTAGIAALLAVVFLVVRGLITTILGSLTGITGSIGTLTAPLGTVTTALGTVSGILSNTAAPSDVTRSLASVQNSLALLQGDLGTVLPLTSGAMTVVDQRATTLQTFLNPSTGPVVPRAHLEDTYVQAVKIYDKAVNDLKLSLTGITKVGTAMLNDANNTPQLNPSGSAPPTIDTSLRCASTSTG